MKEDLETLVKYLLQYPNETAWLEFKHNNFDPEMIGKDISALANGAALSEKNRAYMIWGVDDVTHELLGTDHNLQTLKKGNQELENWLRSLLSSNAEFEFHSIIIDTKRIGVLIIYRTVNHPVSFNKCEYIRVGSYTKKLIDYPVLQGQLWEKLRISTFENRFARQDLDLDEALSLLDHTIYFDLCQIPQPSSNQGVAHYMLQEGILVKQDSGLFAITNLGAILFAKRLSEFPRISRKAIRVILYEGNNKMTILKEYTGQKGYVLGFEGLIQFVEALIPSKEVINGALREKKTAYPMLAIREAIANALIHQDFSITGTGPLIELFQHHIEITNPGNPLVDINRIIDTPPKSRNEKLAAMMRHLRMCEELGTGWDKIALCCELNQLPAPKIDVFEDSTRVTMYTEIPFSTIAPEDKLRACYLHACVKYIQGEHLTNCSLRERFGLPASSSSSISRLIKDAVTEGLIKPLDPKTAPRHMKYVPIWA